MFTKPSRTLSASSTTSTGSADGSSRGLQVFLDPPADNAPQDALGKGRLITPGCRLGGIVSVGSVKDAVTLKIQLAGKCSCTVMGKSNRHALNVYSVAGSPAASAAITFREVHVFLDQKKTLWEASEPKLHEPAEYPFSFELPRHKTCSCPCETYILPPSCDLRSGAGETAVWDRSDIQVRYALYATMERKGFLKRDIRVQIPLTLKDDSPPDYANQETNRTKTYGTLKYATSGQAPPRVECELSFAAPTEQGHTVQYTVSYRMAEAAPEAGTSASGMQDKPVPTDDSDLPPLYDAAAPSPLLNEISPKVEVTLSRYCKTRPVELARDGEEHRFPGYALVAGKTDPEDTSDTSLSSHVRFIRGKLQLPAKEVTLFSCGAEIRHMLNARFVSKALLGPVFLSLPIYLPSTV